MSIFISILVVSIVGFAILKKYNAIATLFLGAAVLMAVCAVMGLPVIPEAQSSGNAWLDIFESMNLMFNNRFGGMGLILFALLAYARYMTYIGANDIVINNALRLLGGINKPYLLLAVTFLIGSFISLAGFGATSLAVLLMSTLFPVLNALGLPAISIAAAIATTATISFSPLAVDSVIAAENVGMSVEIYTLKYQIPLAIPSMLAMAAAHYFWQQYMDKKEGLFQQGSTNKVDLKNVDVRTAEVEGKAPGFYGWLPMLPIIVLIVTSGELGLIEGVTMNIGTIAILCLFTAMALEAIRHRSGRTAMEGMSAIVKGMEDALPVVLILVGAGVFAQSLKAIGAINMLIESASQVGFGPTAMMLALVGLTGAVAFLTGSGNAAFYAFVELIPKIADGMGINGVYLVMPMQQASNACRAMSPVAGVIVASSGMAKVSPFDLIKRTIPPITFGLAVNIILSIIFLPMAI
ncbi:C4-dicarboxylate transporter DcuC [Photobacterium swingsii]|uniref:C4-dicarboxylate transporter DcuC n=1 Tax=Photobacterium swingsii TaxID=680026 RepID=UPI0040682F22